MIFQYGQFNRGDVLPCYNKITIFCMIISEFELKELKNKTRKQ